MPTIGERNAARAQRNTDRNAAIQQDNATNNALLQLENRVRELEDRVREVEAQNAMWRSQMEAMGDVIARQALGQQQVQPPLAVNQSPEPVAMNDATVNGRNGRLTEVSVRKSIASLVKNNNNKLG